MTTPSKDAQAVFRRHAVRDLGGDGQAMLLVHGYGCNQAMWHRMLPFFEKEYRIVLMDHVGTGNAELSQWDPSAYLKLDRYAEDVLAVIEALELKDVILVGHSVSAVIGALLAKEHPELIHSLVMIGPSACYMNDGEYRGGFERQDIVEMLDAVESNYIGWSQTIAPHIMGQDNGPEDGAFLADRFCEQDPEVAYVFARATFESDHRPDLPSVPVPTLVLQCSQDIIAPTQVGEYVADQIPRASFHQLSARGHCPNFSAPAETAAAIHQFLAQLHVESVEA